MTINLYFIYEKKTIVFKLLISISVPEMCSVVFIYAIANWFVCSNFITDCLLVFNNLMFKIYISLVVFVVLFFCCFFKP